MERMILFIGFEPPLHEELQEFLDGLHGEAFFAETAAAAIRILNGHSVSKVVLNLRTLNDVAILRYIELYDNRKVEILVSASSEFDEMISIFRQNNYSRLRQPLKLEELKSMI